MKTDSTKLVAGYNSSSLVLFDIETGKNIRNFQQDLSSRINKVISHPSEPMLATCYENGFFSLFDVFSGKSINTKQAHNNSVNTIDFHPMGTEIASGSNDGILKIWDVGSKMCTQELFVPGRVNSVHFHPKKLLLAVGVESNISLYQ